MAAVTHIFFDCMETLVDLTELPGRREYALWAFEGSGAEHCWKDFEEFFADCQRVREQIHAGLPEHKDYEMRERFEHIARSRLYPDGAKIKDITDCLDRNYWKSYSSRCYVKEDVRAALSRLVGKYRLGVVSNFMVKGGIEELLAAGGIRKYFDFVAVSVDIGWRKPHPEIYQAALQKAGAVPGEILFVGDDFINDYIQPRKMGMQSILLDRYDRYADVEDRARDFYQLLEGLEK